MSGFRLQQKQQVSISLCLLVVWKDTFLYIGRIFEMARNFVLLQLISTITASLIPRLLLNPPHLFESHAILD